MEQSLEARIVATPTGQVEYRVRGAGPLVVVVIASTGRACAELDPFAQALAKEGFRVVLPEPRGIAGSTGPNGGADFHGYAADFMAVIDAELPQSNNSRAIVAGHAYGNWIARTLACDYPDRIAGIVLLASSARHWPSELSEAITRITNPETTDQERQAALEDAFFAPGNDPSQWMTGWHAQVIAAQRSARANTSLEDWWTAGDARILDLVGAVDPFRPSGTERQLRDELGSQVTAQKIANASHAMPTEQPPAAAVAIARRFRDPTSGVRIVT